MIYLQVYLIISLFLTITTAYMLKERFGNLEFVVQTLRKMDESFAKAFKSASDTQVVVLFLVAGFISSPFIAAYMLMERTK